MQKVSKQSLAMIALSILLAISIALTFTFAALSDSRTASGTITFSGNVTVEYNGETADGKIVFTTNYASSENVDANSVTTDNKSFVIAGSAAYAKITFTYTTQTGVKVQVRNPFDSGAEFATINGNTSYASATTVQTGTQISVGDVLKVTFNPNAQLPTEFSISITVDADTRSQLS